MWGTDRVKYHDVVPGPLKEEARAVAVSVWTVENHPPHLAPERGRRSAMATGESSRHVARREFLKRSIALTATLGLAACAPAAAPSPTAAPAKPTEAPKPAAAPAAPAPAPAAPAPAAPASAKAPAVKRPPVLNVGIWGGTWGEMAQE